MRRVKFRNLNKTGEVKISFDRFSNTIDQAKCLISQKAEEFV
jgi:hypothetical protein